MSRISIYSYNVPAEGAPPRELSLSEVQHEAVPDDVYGRHVSGSGAVYGWVLPAEVEEFLVFPRPGDVVVFHRGEDCLLVATIAEITEAPALAATLAGEEATGSVVFLEDAEPVDRPLSEVVGQLNPSMSGGAVHPPGLLVQRETEWAAERGVYSYAGPLLDRFERRRIYDLVLPERASGGLAGILAPGPESTLSGLADAADALLASTFRGPGTLRTLKVVGSLALAAAVVLAAAAELFWCSLAGLGVAVPGLPGRCLHLLVPGLVAPAAALSGGLAAFLLAGTAVVALGRLRAPDRGVGDLELEIREAARPAPETDADPAALADARGDDVPAAGAGGEQRDAGDDGAGDDGGSGDDGGGSDDGAEPDKPVAGTALGEGFEISHGDDLGRSSPGGDEAADSEPGEGPDRAPDGGRSVARRDTVRFEGLRVRRFDGRGAPQEGTVSWSAPAIGDGRVALDEVRADPPGIGPSPGTYRLRRLRGRLPPETAPGDRGWRVTGHLDLDGLAGTRVGRLVDADGRLDWWVEPVDRSGAAAVRDGIGTALAYALTAGVLGAVVVGFPWTPDPGSAWMAGLSPGGHVLYTGLTYLFAAAFVGTVYRTADLVESMVDLATDAGP